MNNLDLSQFNTRDAANDGAWLHLENPLDGELLYADDDKTQPCRLKLLGIDSSTFKSVSNRLSSAQVSKSMAKRRGKVSIDMDKIDSNRVEVLCSVTVAAENLSWQDKPVDVTDKAQMTMIYTEASWIFEQVDEFVAERKNYLGNSSKVSSTGQE